MEVEKKPTHTPLAGSSLGTGHSLGYSRKWRINVFWDALFVTFPAAGCPACKCSHLDPNPHWAGGSKHKVPLEPSSPHCPSGARPRWPLPVHCQSQTPLSLFHFGILFTLFYLSLSLCCCSYSAYRSFNTKGILCCSVQYYSIIMLWKREDSEDLLWSNKLLQYPCDHFATHQCHHVATISNLSQCKRLETFWNIYLLYYKHS